MNRSASQISGDFKKIRGLMTTKIEILIRVLFLIMLFSGLIFTGGCSKKTGVEIDYSIQPRPSECQCKSQLKLVVDQLNINLVEPFYYNIYNGPLGQEFIPDLYALDVVELHLADANCSSGGGNGGELQVRIREASIEGRILGISDTMHFANCFAGIMRFNLPEFITVVPGKKYVLEPVYVSGNTCIFYMDNGTASDYSGGSFILFGNIEIGKDMWFKEGLYNSVARTQEQAAHEGWKKLVRHDGTIFKNQSDCTSYIENTRK